MSSPVPERAKYARLILLQMKVVNGTMPQIIIVLHHALPSSRIWEWSTMPHVHSSTTWCSVSLAAIAMLTVNNALPLLQRVTTEKRESMDFIVPMLLSSAINLLRITEWSFMLLVQELRVHHKVRRHAQVNAQRERYALIISVRAKLMRNMLDSIVPLKHSVSQMLIRMVNHSTLLAQKKQI